MVFRVFCSGLHSSLRKTVLQCFQSSNKTGVQIKTKKYLQNFELQPKWTYTYKLVADIKLYAKGVTYSRWFCIFCMYLCVPRLFEDILNEAHDCTDIRFSENGLWTPVQPKSSSSNTSTKKQTAVVHTIFGWYFLCCHVTCCGDSFSHHALCVILPHYVKMLFFKFLMCYVFVLYVFFPNTRNS